MKMNRWIIVAFFVVSFLPIPGFADTSPVVLQSPGGQLAITFETATTNNRPAPAGGRLVYSVAFQGKPVIEMSGLSLELRGQEPLGARVRITGATNSTTDETYRLLAGKASRVRNHFNAVQIAVEETGSLKRQLIIEARAYDDAVAFRYVVPDQPFVDEFRLTAEKTEFRFTKDATTYALLLPNFRSMYESEFVKLPSSAFANQGGISSSVLLGCPLLAELPGVAWVTITEADLRDYSAMYLVNGAGSWDTHRFESRLAPQVNDTNVCVVGNLPHQSAWRVLLIADNPGRFIESTTLTSLNPESAITDTSWIHAGKASWDWWSGSIGPDGKSAFNTDTMKFYVDFAAKSGFEYMLIDAGWSARNDITKTNGRVDVPEVVRYASNKNVKVWIWLHHDAAAKQMAQAFPIFARWGVAGLKIDFVERDDQEGMSWYYRTAELAASNHLMLDFHGSTKPTGMERTWPNVLGYEGVVGMEQSKAGARDNPEHRVTLPFTRNVAGPMDYTPGGFRNVTRDAFEPQMTLPVVMGTRAQQLAMYVVYFAPIQMVSDCPQAYEGRPEFQFIKDVPAAWDETRAINGVPGEYVTVARRSGDTWFLGSMTDWKPRQLDVPLTFLIGTGRYTAEIYSDAPDADKYPTHAVIEKKTVTRKSHLRLQLAPGGGCAVRFVPKR